MLWNDDGECDGVDDGECDVLALLIMMILMAMLNKLYVV